MWNTPRTSVGGGRQDGEGVASRGGGRRAKVTLARTAATRAAVPISACFPKITVIVPRRRRPLQAGVASQRGRPVRPLPGEIGIRPCLLYTSDAADDLLCV